jgi:decaprenylphospho-beta-D-erythro-pentofuranosid-2-ulose 2-reductase
LRIRHGGAVSVVPFDALDFASHAGFFRTSVEQSREGLSGIVLCYGAMSSQEQAQSDFAATRAMIDTNYTSAASILNVAADYFAVRKKGFICAISSVAGDRGRQSNYIYGSSKAALTTFMHGLRVRMAKVGVPVTVIKPGFVDTAMTWGLPGLFLVASPEKAAADIARAVRKGKAEAYTPWFWWGIMTIIKSVPDVIFKRMKM